MANDKLKPSEFEGSGPFPFGGFGLNKAWEKLRYAMRTGIDPEKAVDLNAPADQYPRETKHY